MAEGQRAADALTEAEFKRMHEEAENALKLSALHKEVQERETQAKGYNKREAALAAMDKGMKQGKHLKKGNGSKALESSHPYKKGWQ